MKNIYRLTERDITRIIRRVINEQQTTIKSGESLNDEQLLIKACAAWENYDINQRYDIFKWSVDNFKLRYPLNMDANCVQEAKEVIKDNNDRTIMKSIIDQTWKTTS